MADNNITENDRTRCGSPTLVRYIYIPVVFLAAVAMSPLATVFDQYIYYSIAVDQGLINTSHTLAHNQSACERNVTILSAKVDSLASYFTLYSKLSCDLPAFLAMPIWAAYGDRRGRRKPVLISSAGVLASLGLLLAVIRWKLALWLTLFCFALQGITGYLGLTVCIACAAQIAHHGSPAHRTMQMAVMELTYYTGGTLGNFAAGYVLGFFGFAWCFAIIGGLVVLLLFYCFCALESGPDTSAPCHSSDDHSAGGPDSTVQQVSYDNFTTTDDDDDDDDDKDHDDDDRPLVPTKEPTSSGTITTITSTVAAPYKLYFTISPGDDPTVRKRLLIILAVAYLHESANAGSYNVTDIFAVSAPLCWNPIKLGYYRYTVKCRYITYKPIYVQAISYIYVLYGI